jgi:hypothetical protein
MFGRIKKSNGNTNVEAAPPAPPRRADPPPFRRDFDDDDDDGDDGEMPVPASQLTGQMSSGVSLDGRSLILPSGEDRAMADDDVSSINTSNYDFKGDMRILGPADNGEDQGYAGRPNMETPAHDDDGYHKKSRQAQQNGAYEHKNYDYNTGMSANNNPNSNRHSKDDKTLGTVDSQDGGCLPFWITEAPAWLKMVIVLSTALLVGAIVLIGVGAALAVQNDQAQQQLQNQGDDFAPSFPNLPTQSATVMPEMDDDLSSPVAVGVPFPTAAPEEPEPTPDPTEAPPSTSPPTEQGATPAPTPAPTSAPTSSKVSFFVTGGRFTGETLAALPDQLATLPDWQGDGQTNLFHLGDWNSPYATQCVEESYEANTELYQNSAVPVYFVPGDNEFNGTQCITWRSVLM